MTSARPTRTAVPCRGWADEKRPGVPCAASSGPDAAADPPAVASGRELPPARVLLCLGACYGEFYLPLSYGDRIACPVDAAHPVAVYRDPVIHDDAR